MLSLCCHETVRAPLSDLIHETHQTDVYEYFEFVVLSRKAAGACAQCVWELAVPDTVSPTTTPTLGGHEPMSPAQ